VDVVDATTFTVRWKQPYPWANELGPQDLPPLPFHLLAELYDAGSADAFVNSPFWSTAYVGNGPYRLVDRDLGVHLTFRAFDEYFMGRPRIDEIIFRVISDENTVVASVLSGELDATVGITVGLRGGLNIRNRWGEGEVVFTPVRWNYVQIQLDPARNQQPALFDPRVRKAMAHAVDRHAMAEAATEGAFAVIAEAPIIPSDCSRRSSRTRTTSPAPPRCCRRRAGPGGAIGWSTPPATRSRWRPGCWRVAAAPTSRTPSSRPISAASAWT
jgi:peptide/nickel transport system substrate-binding protein